MKKPAFDPNREEVEEAVKVYLKNGGKIDDQRIQAKMEIRKRIEKTWAGGTGWKSEQLGGSSKPEDL